MGRDRSDPCLFRLRRAPRTNSRSECPKRDELEKISDSLTFGKYLVGPYENETSDLERSCLSRFCRAKSIVLPQFEIFGICMSKRKMSKFLQGFPRSYRTVQVLAMKINKRVSAFDTPSFDFRDIRHAYSPIPSFSEKSLASLQVRLRKSTTDCLRFFVLSSRSSL